MTGYISRFIHLPGYIKIMLPEALILSAIYRFRMCRKPFGQWCMTIGIKGKETSADEMDKEKINLILRVSKCVNVVCNHTPWESKCMVRALTAKKMLNRRKLACTIYMGVSRDNSGKMIAHAWLRCGSVYVTGGRGTGFAVTEKFGDVRI